VTLDLREAFRATVVKPFVDGYASGVTPNPCMRCNGSFRFAELVRFAERVGADVLWTGHYARVVERNGSRLVARGLDPEKDQSYMLATVEPALFERVGFPLGGTTKAAVREEAAALRLDAARRPESQEACFLAGGDYRTFLGRHGVASAPGDIVDQDGKILGRHDGLWRFTPGQRRGLGLASREPLHVLRVDPGANALVVGPRSALATRRLTARGRLYDAVVEADAKVRYRSPAVPASVTPTPDGFVLDLHEPVGAVAPGQVAVLYEGDVVVGAGVIDTVTG
jgi:tRNA-specific 2-thiouridylase